MVAGREVELTPTEFRLLGALVRHPNQVLSREQLLEQVWGNSRGHSRDQVKLYVSYLRRKLSDAGGIDPVETVRGFGYRYEPRVVAEAPRLSRRRAARPPEGDPPRPA